MNHSHSFQQTQHMRPSSARASIQTPSQFFVNHSNVMQGNRNALNQQQQEFERKKDFDRMRQTFNLENDVKEYTSVQNVLINQGFYDQSQLGQKRIVKKNRNNVNNNEMQLENNNSKNAPLFATTYTTQFKPDISQTQTDKHGRNFWQEKQQDSRVAKSKREIKRNPSCILSGQQQQKQLQSPKGKLMVEIEKNNKEFFDHLGGQCDCYKCDCGKCRCYWNQQNKPLLSTIHLAEAGQSQYQVQFLDKMHNNLQLSYYPSPQPLRKGDGQPVLTENKRQYCQYKEDNYKLKKQYDSIEKPLPTADFIQQKTQYNYQYKTAEPHKQRAALQQSKNFQFIPPKTVITSNIPLQNTTHYSQTFKPIDTDFLSEEVAEANEQCLKNLNTKDPSSPMRESYAAQEALQSIAHSELNEKEIQLDQRYQPKLSVQYPSFNDQFKTMNAKTFQQYSLKGCKCKENSKTKYPLRIYN